MRSCQPNNAGRMVTVWGTYVISISTRISTPSMGIRSRNISFREILEMELVTNRQTPSGGAVRLIRK